MTHNHGEGFQIYKYADGGASAGPRDPGLPPASQEVPVSIHTYMMACDQSDCIDQTDCTNLRATVAVDPTPAAIIAAEASARATGEIFGADPQAVLDAAVVAIAARPGQPQEPPGK